MEPFGVFCDIGVPSLVFFHLLDRLFFCRLSETWLSIFLDESSDPLQSHIANLMVLKLGRIVLAEPLVLHKVIVSLPNYYDMNFVGDEQDVSLFESETS